MVLCNLCRDEIKDELKMYCGDPHHKQCLDEFKKVLDEALSTVEPRQTVAA
jgi:hypothetical protein